MPEKENLATASKELGVAKVVGIVQDHWVHLVKKAIMLIAASWDDESEHLWEKLPVTRSPMPLWVIAQRVQWEGIRFESSPKRKPRQAKMTQEGTNWDQVFIHLLSRKNIPLAEMISEHLLNCLPSRWWRWEWRRLRWPRTGGWRSPPWSWRRREGRRQPPIPHAPLETLSQSLGCNQGWGWFEQSVVLASSCDGSWVKTAMRVYFLFERICAVAYSNICLHIAISISSKHHALFRDDLRETRN